jgi:hypothetical protein
MPVETSTTRTGSHPPHAADDRTASVDSRAAPRFRDQGLDTAIFTSLADAARWLGE